MTAPSPSREEQVGFTLYAAQYLAEHGRTPVRFGSEAARRMWTAIAQDAILALPEPPDVAGLRAEVERLTNVVASGVSMDAVMSAYDECFAAQIAAEAQVARLTEALRRVRSFIDLCTRMGNWINRASATLLLGHIDAALNPNPASDGEAG